MVWQWMVVVCCCLATVVVLSGSVEAIPTATTWQPSSSRIETIFQSSAETEAEEARREEESVASRLLDSLSPSFQLAFAGAGDDSYDNPTVDMTALVVYGKHYTQDVCVTTDRQSISLLIFSHPLELFESIVLCMYLSSAYILLVVLCIYPVGRPLHVTC